MSIIIRAGYYSGRPYQFNIAGDTPTVDEDQRIDALVNQYEKDYRNWYVEKGVDMPPSEPGILALPGYFAAGATGMLGSAAQGALSIASPIIPDFLEKPAEEGIRRAQYETRKLLTPDAIDESGMAVKIAEGAGGILLPSILMFFFFKAFIARSHRARQSQ